MTVTKEELQRELHRIEAETEKDGWDQDARVYVLYEGMDPNLEDQKYIPGTAVASRLDLPPETWFTEPMASRPFAVLEILAAAAQVGPAIGIYTPPDLIGIVFICEGWQIEVNPATDLLEEEAEAVADHRLIHLHPLRKEIRSVYAASLEGDFLFGIRPRDEEFTLNGYQEHGGTIPKLLKELAEVIRDAREGSNR